MTKIIKIISKFFKKIKNIKYTKKLALEKRKLYVKDDNIFKNKYIKKNRNKFKLFKTKLEFENTFQDIKNINIYYYIMWLFLIISSLYLFIFSHYFSIKNIDIIRQDDLVNINIAYNSIENIRYKPLIFVNKEEIKNYILAHQPNILDIYIRKILPDSLKIILQSSESVFSFNLWDKIYEITKNWTVIPGKEKENITKIKIVWFDNLWIIDYKKIFDEYYINQIIQLLYQLNQKISLLIHKNYTYYKKEAELHIITEKWTIIIFDLNKDINIQIEKLNIFYKEYISKVKNAIIYIDLRINQKVIYCDSSNEFQCRLNLNSIYN